MKKKEIKADPEPAVSQADYELLAGFRHTLRQFIHFSEEAAAFAGVPPHQHQAMLIIRALSSRGAVTVGEIASQLLIRHQSAVGLVNRMVKTGLVCKRQSLADRRQVVVQLVARGERMLKRLSASHKAEVARIGPVLQGTLDQINIA